MQIIHIAENSDGYEIVTLLANRIHRTNNLAAIQKDGQVYYTGGFLFNDTPTIRRIFDGIPKSEQYKFAQELKNDPFAKSYYDTERVKQQEAAL